MFQILTPTTALAAALVLLASHSADAANVQIEQRPISDAALFNDPMLSGAYSFRIVVDSDDDILSGRLTVDLSQGTIYQNAFGSDNAPPNPALVTAFPALDYDTYVNTPGPTTILAGSFDSDGTTNSSPTSEAIEFGDTTNNGPVADFTLAQITVLPENGRIQGLFRGEVFENINGEAVSTPFEGPIPIPEPATAALLLGLVPLLRRRRA